MTLSELSDIAQAIGAVAILVSLAAVYGQVRQTNKIARADLTHSVWLTGGQMQVALFDTPEKAELMHRALYGTGPLSDPEKLRMISVIAAALGVHEAAFTVRQRGLMEEGAYKGFEAVAAAYLRSPIVQQWWAENRNGKDPAYVALIDGIVAQIKQNALARAGGASPRGE